MFSSSSIFKCNGKFQDNIISNDHHLKQNSVQDRYLLKPFKFYEWLSLRAYKESLVSLVSLERKISIMMLAKNSIFPPIISFYLIKQNPFCYPKT